MRMIKKNILRMHLVFLWSLMICFSLSLFSGDSFSRSLLVNGAGATFPYPIYSKWFIDYRKIDPSIQLNYQSIGSGGGIRQFTDGTVDFGASDAPMTDQEIKKVKKGVLHIPSVVGAVVISYHLPNINESINLTGELVGEIFLGKIKRWNDPKIQSLNKNLKLPDLALTVVHRSDGSGTTHVFTEYVAKVNEQWNKNVGAGKAVKWPTGLGGKGNEGVAGLIKQMPGAIGYVELVYALQNKLSHAKIKNKSGEFISATLESVTLAASGAASTMPADFRASITDAPGKGVYPISAYTYLLFPLSLEKEKGEKMIRFIKWALKDGQKMAQDIGFSPLPDSVIKKIEKSLSLIKKN